MGTILPFVNELEVIIREEIRGLGPMRFDRFMELALYHPELGYYAAERPIGQRGDFFTSVSVGPLFGRLLARQARQMWRLLGETRPFWIIEQGAHDGRLAINILEGCRSLGREFFEAVQYAIIEPSKARREAQTRRLVEVNLAASVHWMAGLDEMAQAKPVGLFLCNELVDAFPVRVIRYRTDTWKERHVTLEGDALSWMDLPVADDVLAHAIDELRLPRVEGYTTEINLAVRSWMHEVATTLERGYALVIDYGFPGSVYYAPFRSDGTLTAYHAHKRSSEVLLRPGEQDITAHVDFTALSNAAEASGLKPLALVDQQRFLTGVAHDELSGAENHGETISAHLRAWNTLTHPEHLGARFQVLVLAKNASPDLDGLRFAKPGGMD